MSHELASRLVVLGNVIAIFLVVLAFLQIFSWTLIGLMILAALILPMLFSRGTPRASRAARISSGRSSASREVLISSKSHRHHAAEKIASRPHQIPSKLDSQKSKGIQENQRLTQSKPVLAKPIPVRSSPAPRIEATPVAPSEIVLKSAVALPEPENRTVIVKGDYSKYDLELKEGDEVACDINASCAVNVYLLDQDNLTSLDMGEEFWQEAGEENVESTTVHFTAPSTGKWFLVVENTDFKEVTATVNIRK